MLLAKGAREDAIHALINTWLRLPNRWCLTCEKELDEVFPIWPCCDEPFLTTNQLVFQRFIKEMEYLRDEQKNKFASSGTDTGMRYLLRFPPGLLQFLEMSMKRMYGEKLFNEEYSEIWFAKKFKKYFVVADEI